MWYHRFLSRGVLQRYAYEWCGVVQALLTSVLTNYIVRHSYICNLQVTKCPSHSCTYKISSLQRQSTWKSTNLLWLEHINEMQTNAEEITLYVFMVKVCESAHSMHNAIYAYMAYIYEYTWMLVGGCLGTQSKWMRAFVCLWTASVQSIVPCYGSSHTWYPMCDCTLFKPSTIFNSE